MKRVLLSSICIVFTLSLFISAPKADILVIDDDPPNLGGPWVGGDTNPGDVSNSNPTSEEWWLEALLGLNYDDPSIEYIDRQDPSGLDNQTTWGTYDPSSWAPNPITVPWDYAVVKIGGGQGFANYAFYDSNFDDLLTLPDGLVLTNGVSHISYFVDPAPIPEPATMLLFGVGLVGLAGTRLRRKR